jgi:hypothetical protein
MVEEGRVIKIKGVGEETIKKLATQKVKAIKADKPVELKKIA